MMIFVLLHLKANQSTKRKSTAEKLSKCHISQSTKNNKVTGFYIKVVSL